MKVIVHTIVALVAATAGAVALKASGPVVAGERDFRLLTLSSPRSLVSNEQYAVYGGLRVPAGTFETRLLACGPNACETLGRGGVAGPGVWWGYLGNLNLPAGEYEVVLGLFRPADELGIAVAQYTWRVSAH